jgi:hypothetical protein
VFVTVDAMGNLTPDILDRMATVTVDVAANSSAAVGIGSAELANFPPANKLEIAFQQVTAYQTPTGGGGSGTLGCKARRAAKSCRC